MKNCHLASDQLGVPWKQAPPPHLGCHGDENGGSVRFVEGAFSHRWLLGVMTVEESAAKCD